MTVLLKQYWKYALVIAAAIPLVFILSNFTSARQPTLSEGYSDSDLEFQGNRLRGFALGAEGLLADIYWMRSLQYIGDKVLNSQSEMIDVENLRPLNPRLLYPFLENATDLDPHFMAPYSYGAVVLPAIDPDLAIKLAQKGITNNPDTWRLYQYLGYIYWRNKDYEKAADAYEKGSAITGAPVFMKTMSAAMRTQGGSRETARAIYSQIRDEADDQQAKENAAARLMQIDSLDERDAVNRLLAEYAAANGRCVTKIGEVFSQLRNVKLPNNREFMINDRNELADPSGVAYVLNSNACTIELSPESKIPRL